MTVLCCLTVYPWEMPAPRSSAHRRFSLPQGGFTALKRIFGLIGPYSRHLAIGVAGVVVATLISLVFPLLIRELLNHAFGASANGSDALSILNRITILLVVLMLVQAVFNYLRTSHLGQAGERIVASLRERLFSHLMGLGVPFFEERKTGEITSRLTSDIATVQSAVTNLVAQVITQLLSLVGGTALLFFLEPRLTLVMLAVIPPVALAATLFGRSLRRTSTKFQDQLAGANAIADEAIANVRIVKSFTGEGFEASRYAKAIAGALDTALIRVRLRALFVPVVLLSVFAGLTFVLWYGGRLAVAGSLASGDLVAFLLITVTVGTAIGTFMELWGQLQEAVGASLRIFELLDEAQPDETGAAPMPEHITGEVVFAGVSFAYPSRKEQPVLQNLSFTVPAGEVYALVGRSGAGKSTIAALLPRFYDIDAGEILIDGHDVRNWKRHDLRSIIGAVPQETLLFSGTVFDNILYGRPGASEAEVHEAARLANAYEFIEQFEHGFNTIVGERGVQLSGGQRQRVAIARAILKNPRILILDEATSALDAESEQAVQDALDRLMKGRTTIVIAHRLSTILGADQILIIDNHTVAEAGTHDELINNGGLYQELYNTHFLGAEEL